MSDDVDAPHQRWVTYHEGLSVRDALQAIADRELPLMTSVVWKAMSGSETLGWLRQTSPDVRSHTIVRLVGETAAFTASQLHFVYLSSDEIPAE